MQLTSTVLVVMANVTEINCSCASCAICCVCVCAAAAANLCETWKITV